MSLFQNSVLKKYLKSQHTEELKEKWVLFKAYFHNATIQENIRNSKEEQFQEGFLRELFVKVLGYTLNPEPNFNLTTEYKNVKDSKKADGAIIINNQVKAVIELKGTDTTDLGKVESQAFNYKNNQPECVYVITSNFEKIRIYIDNAIEHLEFNLFNLTEEEFHLLYVCLAHKNIKSNVAKHIKDESVSQEDVITKKLYNDYSLFKRELYQNLVKLNPGYDPLELFKKSQKLLDRFLFIFFAEDRSLLPTNLIFRINKEWQQLREMRIDVSLYDRYKVYFNDLNHGARVSLPAFSQTSGAKKEEYEIYAYNGGLFKDDEILNSVKIDDDILFKYTEKLSNYDFASEVDVNILGHIFENSLNELDEIKAQLEGQEVEKTKTKRKKDGVFYTPKYITKYIVDNTVGKLCSDKKAELQLNEADYATDKKRQKKTIHDLSDKLNTYRNWLLQLTICDPACGSGAFLNQALDFLIAEHRYIDELQAKLFGDALVLSDVEGSILENNLFGVDINEESIEIAKLSLWLRTAQPNRKLNDLSSNIKCGNSLIDDITVAGDKAFNWKYEFKRVFENGGFDVIIGNPPYVSFQNIDDKQKQFLTTYFKSASGKFDLYVVFVECGINLLKNAGYISYIMPNKFLVSNYGEGVKEIILKKQISKIVDFKDRQLFEGATTYPCIIIIHNIQADTNFEYIDVSKSMNDVTGSAYTINRNKLSTSGWHLGNNRENEILIKLEQLTPLKTYAKAITQGIRTGKLDVYSSSLTDDEVVRLRLEKELLYKTYTGKNVKRYSSLVSENDILLFPYINEEPITIENFPYTFQYLNKHKEELLLRKDSGKVFRDINKKWFEFWDPKFITFSKPKIVFPDISCENNFYLDTVGLPFLNTCYSIFLKDESKYREILMILNSKLFLFYIKKVSPSISGGYYRYKTGYVENFGIKSFNNIDLEKYEEITSLNKELQELSQKFQRTLQRKIELEYLPKKLEYWYSLSYSDFIKELAKKKIKLSLTEEAEWEEYFNIESKKALELKAKIDATDKEIDQMVYKLYDLTEEEIKIVEENTK